MLAYRLVRLNSHLNHALWVERGLTYCKRIVEFLYFVLEVFNSSALVELKKKDRGESTETAEQMEQLQPADEEAATKTYQNVDTAYQPQTMMLYEPRTATNNFEECKEGVNVQVHGVR